MNSLVRSIDRLTGATGVIGAWLVAPLMIVTCFEIFSRYALNNPTTWAFEMGTMLTGANFLLGMAFALRQGAHIRIEIFYMRFSRRTQALVDGFSYVFIVVPVCSWLAYGLYHYALQAYQWGETSGMSAWNPVVWPFRVTFVVAFTMLVLQAVSELIKCIAILRQRDDEFADDIAVRPATETEDV